MSNQHNLPTVYAQGWANYQRALIRVLAPLSAEQLDLRATPHLRSIGEIARHIIGARARWFQIDSHEGAAELEALGQWDRKTAPTRTAAELVEGLEQTWQLMNAARARWTPGEWEHVFRDDSNDPAEFTRAWVVWHLVEHDLHHGGEISLTLGMHNLAAPDI